MRVLFTVWPYSGHVYPCLAVALALRERGHEVAFYTGDGARGAVDGEGLRRFPFQAVARNVADLIGSKDSSDHSQLYTQLSDRYTGVATGPLSRLKQIQKFYLEMIVGTVDSQVEDLGPVLDAFRPQAIVTDAFLWAPVLILRETQSAPVAILSFFGGCLVPGPDAPPPGLGLPRPQDWRTRGISRLAIMMSLRATAGIRSSADQVRHRHGLPPLGRPFFEAAGELPLHMVTCSPEYDYQRNDLPATVQYVGPCVYNPPMPKQGWRENLDPTRPVVYVSEGTCQMREPVVLKSAARGLADTSYQVVMSTGTHRQVSLGDLGCTASNVTIASWVSHEELFPRANVIVCNGGSGTVRAALQAGIPLVLVPMEWDQLENAQRVVEAGAGVRLSMSQCTPERIRAAVDRVLSDPSFSGNARRLADSFTRYGNGQRAAQLIETLQTAKATPRLATVAR